jgi:hypothetical protein
MLHTHRSQPSRSSSPASATQSLSASPYSFVRKSAPRPSAVFDTYWRFAVERQAIYHRRITGASLPWTADSILQQHKFTNAYRASDRVSQYLIREIIYGGRFDWTSTVLRVLLFKIFNKIETWKLLEHVFGSIDAKSFNVEAFSNVLEQARSAGGSIYSAAYIMPSGVSDGPRGRKHVMHLELLASEIAKGLPADLLEAPTMEAAYQRLLSIPSFGRFLAYQFIIDLNYADELRFSEMEFVVPGPGARDGIRKCFVDLGDYDETDLIRWVTERQSQEFDRLGLKFADLWGRPLQLIDCQNLFCEVDKYARVAHPDVSGISGRTRIKQKFAVNMHPVPSPWFPPKWEINGAIPRVAQTGRSRK